MSLPKSAELLRELRAQFGNLGLAAAAYNAGPQRVRDWLAGKRGLPSETLAYVRSVTGHSAEEWKKADVRTVTIPADTPCVGATQLAAKPCDADRATANAERRLGRPTGRRPFGEQRIGPIQSAAQEVSGNPRRP